jgi:methylated-DNA-protein-cysteine methyltransferase-like protein
VAEGRRLKVEGEGLNDYEAIYAATRRIPPGSVATYGQIAELAGLPGHARQVGYAMSCLDEDTDVPWHRVVNAKGEISRRAWSNGCEDFQQTLLEDEGVAGSR